jgi:glutamate racemase
MLKPQAPIGVFDSGVGGLSVLRVLRRLLPFENWIYFADSAHAPYGEKPHDYIVDRSHTIVNQLLEQHQIKALVVACNTATAVAIEALRQQHPALPIVGIEPGIKPALSFSQTSRIGVMATQRTISSVKFQRLLLSMSDQADFVLQPCDGLAHAIETQNHIKTEALISMYTSSMGNFGTKNSAIDTLVLGCTHYPLVASNIQQCVGHDVMLIDPGEGVARQLQRLLTQAHQSAPGPLPGRVISATTADLKELEAAMNRWVHG